LLRSHDLVSEEGWRFTPDGELEEGGGYFTERLFDKTVKVPDTPPGFAAEVTVDVEAWDGQPQVDLTSGGEVMTVAVAAATVQLLSEALVVARSYQPPGWMVSPGGLARRKAELLAQWEQEAERETWEHFGPCSSCGCTEYAPREP